MQARVVVFPIRGRAWCFARPRAVLPATSASAAGGDGALPPPPTLKDLWRGVSAGGRTSPENAEAVADFVADKMNRAWIGFGSAPEGSVKRHIHSFGLKLLSRVRPSENLLKSMTKDVSMLEIVHPASINPHLVRRRLRHIAVRGAAIHKKYLYGSICMLPVTSVFMVLPLPNIPFFWTLFRAYSHWRALQGSEKLYLLVSDCSGQEKTLLEKKNGMGTRKDGDSQYTPWGYTIESMMRKHGSSHHTYDILLGKKFQPSEKLDRFLERRGLDEGLDCDTISSICQAYDLDKIDVLKYRDLEWPKSASGAT